MAPRHKLYCRHIAAAYFKAPQRQNTRKKCQSCGCQRTLKSKSTHPSGAVSTPHQHWLDPKIPFSANICTSQLDFWTSHPLLLGRILIFLLSFGLHTMGCANCLETWLANVLEISQVPFIPMCFRLQGGFWHCRIVGVFWILPQAAKKIGQIRIVIKK